MVDLAVSLGGVALNNPIIPASGTCGYGAEMVEIYDLNALGALAIKGTTLEPRFGNPAPRVAECEGGMLNAVGLQNPGIERVLSDELPALRAHFRRPIIANISGFSIDEYVRCCALMDPEPQVEIIEVNISCPNVHAGGMSFGTDPDSAAQVTRAVKAVCTKPVFIKLTPNVTDIVAIARACEQAGADGLSLINTLMGMRIDIRARRPILANTTGGLSGPAVFPVALRMIYDVYRAVKIPIMGMGGVMDAQGAIEMMMAGATAVQVGAANLRNPFACPDIIAALPSALEALNIRRIADIIGAANQR